mmetsp:Transcript_7496/g.13057  ORF Transcript_7496/g.13057 Transcript_7496/m.13057 type:complete len:92 (-) Transcript_7496:16-291(-)
MSSLDHVSISELHRLSTLSTKLSSNDNFTSLRAGLHDKPYNSITGSADGKSSQELVFQRLGLSLGTKSTVLNTFSVKLDSTLVEVKSLLYH